MPGHGGRRALALLGALAFGGLSAWVALAGTFWGFGLKCDDSCGTPPPWREDPGAWQWAALGSSALGVLACAVVLLVAVATRRRTLGRAAAVGWAAFGLAFLVLLSGSGLA